MPEEIHNGDYYRASAATEGERTGYRAGNEIRRVYETQLRGKAEPLAEATSQSQEVNGPIQARDLESKRTTREMRND